MATRMARTVHCVKLKQDLDGLEKPPIKGPFGQRLYDNVSKQAWSMWLEYSKMLINEFRLDLVSPEGQRIWLDQCDKFFFGGEEAAPPPEYVPPKSS
jgi:Fe-S cluster biosynthesis and repair protein YggX